MAIDSSEMSNIKSDNISSHLMDDVTRSICVTEKHVDLSLSHDKLRPRSPAPPTSYVKKDEKDTRKQLVVSLFFFSSLHCFSHDEMTKYTERG